MELANDAPLFTKLPYVVHIANVDMEHNGSKFIQGYQVANVDTGVVEFISPSLPACMQYAHHSASAIAWFNSPASEEDIDIDITFLETTDE